MRRLIDAIRSWRAALALVAAVLFLVTSVIVADHRSRPPARPMQSTPAPTIDPTSSDFARDVAATPRATTAGSPSARSDARAWRLRWYRVGNGEPNGHSRASVGSVSADGRYVVFSSQADDVVPRDVTRCRRYTHDTHPTSCSDVFVHDRVLHRTAMVSVDAKGAQRARDGEWPAISADGRYAVFDVTRRSGTHTSGVGDIQVLLKDLRTGSESVVSRATDGRIADANSHVCSISSDGRFVAFTSYAKNLAPGHQHGQGGAYVRDVRLHTTMVVSDYENGDAAAAPLGCAVLSGDGHTVAFWSLQRLTPDDVDNGEDVFVRDLPTGDLESLPVSNPPYPLHAVGVSWDGMRLAFYERAHASQAPSVPATPAENVSPDERLFVWDRGTRERVVVADTCDYDETSNDGMYYQCPGAIAWSRDGRYLALEGGVPLTDNARPNNKNVYRYDTQTKRFELVSVSGNEHQAEGWTTLAGMSGDGKVIAFTSGAFNVVAGDRRGTTCYMPDGMPACNDVFVRDLALGTTARASGRAFE